MLFSSEQIAALLNALGLTQSIFKPIPDLVGGITAPVGGLVSSVDGITHGLGLPSIMDLPLLGGLFKEAQGPFVNQNLFKSMSAARDHTLSADGSCVVNPYNPPSIVSQTFPSFDQAKANVFRYRQQRAVNLGSWFVHEQWMTPSLFTCASGPQSAELDIATGWGNTTGARAVLEYHWDTFIKQSDFEYLASIGINTVRLPIGYWSLGPNYCKGTPFESVADVYTNSWSRIMRAINWAGEVGIGVLVDLHGAVGSQNGQSHSGISDGKATFFGNSTNMDLTINVLTYLAQQLASVTNIVGIEILNEPNDDPSLPDFYTRAITTMRQTTAQAGTLPLYIHDGFNIDHYSDFVASRTDFIVEDHHSYFVFSSNDGNMDATQETEQVEGSVADQLTTASQKTRRNLIIGEWSCALVESSLSNMKDPLNARQQFCQGQEQVYSNLTAGWHFWSYMKEDCDSDLDWCFKNAVGNTLPATFFSYNSTAATIPEKSLLLARNVAEMELPSMKEVLGQANGQSSSSESVASDDDTTDDTDTAPSKGSDPGLSRKSLVSRQQRFFSVHSRRSFLPATPKHKKDGIPSPLAGLTSAERSITKGYSDGFLSAKIFAQYGMSRLGFTDQYISDSIAALGPQVIASGTEDFYSVWFKHGLADGEKLVATAANV